MDAEFICQPSLIELVGVESWILAKQWMLWLMYGTMHPIYGEEEERGCVVIEQWMSVVPVLWPNDLLMKNNMSPCYPAIAHQSVVNHLPFLV